MSRFETGVLTQPTNLAALMRLPGRWVDQVRTKKPLQRLILDLDNSVSPTHGDQQGSAYNGHFECTCYHPLFLFNQHGDLERVLLRDGNVHSAADWRSVLDPVVSRYRGEGLPKFFRADPAFASPEVYEYLEAEGFLYAMRLPSNAVLEECIRHLLTRAVGRPPRKPIVMYYSFAYRAKSWRKPRRVVAKVEWHQGKLFPRVGFVVTNLRWSSRRAVRFYNQRGRAEQWIKEGKYALN